ncbi:MAG: alpha/beta hydrolase [Pseudoxanthomonas sp.]
MQDISKASTPARWLIIALVLVLISGVGASAIQTSAGRVQMKDMRWIGASGQQLSGYLLVPPNATEKTPAPAVVSVHGWYNNKEMQDPFWVELSRRGFVVLALDMNAHGNSAPSDWDHVYDGATGVDDAVIQLSNMAFVDNARIGLTGHSSGGSASNAAIALDNARETPLIAASMLQANDWADDLGNDHIASFGKRSIGIIADKYDDFNFWEYAEDGKVLSLPRDFLGTDTAKRILGFDENPATFPGMPEAGKYYTKDVEGGTAYRIIHTPANIHAGVAFSTTSAAQVVDFFDTVFAAPNPIPPESQIWPWKTLFNSIGLAGFFLFLVSVTLVLARTWYFSSVSTQRPGERIAPQPRPEGIGLAWFWGGLLVSALFSGYSFWWAMRNVSGMRSSFSFFPQTPPLVIGVWAAVCGVFAVLMMLLTYHSYGKKRGFSLWNTGVFIRWRALFKTIVLAAVAVAITYSLVFVTRYFFQADFRFWVLNVKAFDPSLLWVAARYLPLFLIYFVAASVSLNCFSHNQLSRWGWVNAAVVALSTNISAIVIIALQYGTFVSTGSPYWTAYKAGVIWIMPVVALLFLAVVMSRIIYRRTGNPYLPGIVNALVFTLITCTSSATVFY